MTGGAGGAGGPPGIPQKKEKQNRTGQTRERTGRGPASKIDTLVRHAIDSSYRPT